MSWWGLEGCAFILLSFTSLCSSYETNWPVQISWIAVHVCLSALLSHRCAASNQRSRKHAEINAVGKQPLLMAGEGRMWMRHTPAALGRRLV